MFFFHTWEKGYLLQTFIYSFRIPLYTLTFFWNRLQKRNIFALWSQQYEYNRRAYTLCLFFFIVQILCVILSTCILILWCKVLEQSSLFFFFISFSFWRVVFPKFAKKRIRTIFGKTKLPSEIVESEIEYRDFLKTSVKKKIYKYIKKKHERYKYTFFWIQYLSELL